jgi:ATP-dependent RNA helicase DDX52/ROK1
MEDPILKRLLFGTSTKKPRSIPLVAKDASGRGSRQGLNISDDEYIAVHDIKYCSDGSLDSKLLDVEDFAKFSGGAYPEPTPVQRAAVPIMRAGRDGIFVAPTGSGKTLAYILGSYRHFPPATGATTSVLIVAPTKELCRQIERAFACFTESVAYLSKHLLKDKKQRRKRLVPAVLVCTPLGIQKYQSRIDLRELKLLIMDEADRLLDPSFVQQLDQLLSKLPDRQHLQKALFSATMPSAAEDLARGLLRVDYVKLVVGAPMASLPNIRQRLVFVGQEQGRWVALRNMIQEGGFAPPSLVFCASIPRVQHLYATLREHLNANVRDRIGVMHAGLTDEERERTMQRFQDGIVWFLITTELMARGLDVPGIASVINYDVPEDSRSYIHRVGRTGRAGTPGLAITFFAVSDKARLPPIIQIIINSSQSVDPWMMQLVTSKMV